LQKTYEAAKSDRCGGGFTVRKMYHSAKLFFAPRIMVVLTVLTSAKSCRIWFRSNVPTVLVLSCADICSVFSREGIYSVPAVDGLTRSYTTHDKLMYISNGVLDNMWRHWMPASFAVRILFVFRCTTSSVFLPPVNLQLRKKILPQTNADCCD
jgi:hypothetical protein